MLKNKKAICITVLFVVLVLSILSAGSISNDVKNESSIPYYESTISYYDGVYSSVSVFIYVDRETGINYLIYCDEAGYGGMGGICPRYNTDGTLYISEI